MEFAGTVRRAGVVAVVASALVVSGCGTKETKEPVQTSAATSSAHTTSAATAAPTSAVTSSVATTQSAQPSAAEAPSQQATDGAQSGAPAAEGLPQLPAQSMVEPVAGGRTATPEEVQAITARLKQPETATTTHQYINTFVDSLCSEMLEQQGGAEAFSLAGLPDAPLNMIPEYEAAATTVTDVSNVKVEGDRATASVTTVTGAGQSATNTMAFRQEQGTWKICS